MYMLLPLTASLLMGWRQTQMKRVTWYRLRIQVLESGWMYRSALRRNPEWGASNAGGRSNVVAAADYFDGVCHCSTSEKINLRKIYYQHQQQYGKAMTTVALLC
jgi:type II secretory pathway component PulJ